MAVHIGMEECVLWLLPPAQSSELSSQTGATRGLCSLYEGPLSTKMYQDSDLSFKRLLVPFLQQVYSCSDPVPPVHRAEKVQPKAASLCQKALKIGAWGTAKDDKGDEGEKPMSTSRGGG